MCCGAKSRTNVIARPGQSPLARSAAPSAAKPASAAVQFEYVGKTRMTPQSNHRHSLPFRHAGSPRGR